MTQTFPWFRLWNDMATDPKWRTIARASRQSISEVMAVAVHMLTHASNANVRGYIDGFEDEDVATALDLATEAVTAIRDAMQGRFLQGDQLLGWDKRQPKREDPGSTGRSIACRERATQCNAVQRSATPEEKREEKEKITPPPSPDGEGKARKTRPPECPHQDIIALYHAILPMCPHIRDWTPARQEKLRARWNEDPKRQNLAYWQRFFEYVATCDFLVGRRPPTNGRKKPFFASLYWMVSAENFAKIREENYEE